MQSTLQESGEASAWQQLAPLLDEAMSRLGKKDRDAVILRFFKEKNLGEVAAALKVTEAAAQRRVLRALEKLRRYFNKRGVSSTTAVIAGAVSAYSVQAAPVGLANSVTAVAVTKGAVASVSTLTLIKGALQIMAWTKAKTAVATGVVVILAAGTTTVVINNSSRRLPANEPRLTASQLVMVESPTSATGEKAYAYTIQIGDTLSGIVKAYRRKHINVTLDSLLAANASLGNKLVVGEKIWIPAPQ